jgi:hypothetical protein
MNGITEELIALLDREKIRACIARLARGEDRRDPALISASCWPDGTSDYGIFAGSFAEYLAWVVPGSPAIAVTQHILGQSVVDLGGNTGRAETHVIAYHRVNMGDGEHDTFIGGRYLDRFEKREQEWRVAHRVMLYDWLQDLGISSDWSQGLMGVQFRGAHFTGRSTGDYSETFFGTRRPERHA